MTTAQIDWFHQPRGEARAMLLNPEQLKANVASSPALASQLVEAAVNGHVFYPAQSFEIGEKFALVWSRGAQRDVTVSSYVRALVLLSGRVATVIMVSIGVLTLCLTNLILFALDRSVFLGPYLASGLVIASIGLLATALSTARVIRSEVPTK